MLKKPNEDKLLEANYRVIKSIIDKLKGQRIFQREAKGIEPDSLEKISQSS